ncbi:uridine phosphorylase, partial [Francisella tularensis subsp. holarctica]|nr:uridine phosphorylase [Francisella tularensis subsp. holarctica]
CLCTVLAKRPTSEYIDKSKYDVGMYNIMMIIKHSIENNFFS